MKIKKALSVLTALCLLLSVFSAGSAVFAESGTEEVTYIDENGAETTVEATVITGGGLYGAEGETNWYVLKGRVTCTENVSFHDAVVNVILADDADWTINSATMCALNLFSGSLNVYGQKEGTGCVSTGQRFGANYGDLHVYGGNILADSGLHADPSSDKDVTIDGGLVRAGALTCKDFFVNGGDVILLRNYASGDVTITGGSFECHCESGIGIQAPEGRVSISGGTVSVSGTQNGIYAREISITGGDVTACGQSTMGLMAKSITINGGRTDVVGGLFSVYSSGEGPVILGCPAADASIRLQNRPEPDTSFAVAEGQTLTDGENLYTGTLTDEQRDALGGKTLTAYVDYAALAAAKAKLTDAVDAAKEFCSVLDRDEKYSDIAAELKTAYERGDAALALDDAQEILAQADSVLLALENAKAAKEAIDAAEPADQGGDTPENACPLCGRVHGKNVVGAIVGFVHHMIWYIARFIKSFD